ncbi:MAG: J domain-containing protein [Anaerolineales bacterium]|nr:J domain-containing protein [Anaerolineales bacterium]
MNFYELLSIAPSADSEQIRAAYRALAQIYHPDRLAHLKPEARAFAEERFKALNQAYGVLSDPAKRAAYDLSLQRPAPPPRAAMRGEPPSTYTPPTGPTPGASPGAARRSQLLERKQRLARLEAEINDLSRNVAVLESERGRARVRTQQLQARNVWRWWFGMLLTALGFTAVLAAGVGLFALPAGAMHPNAQRLALFALVGLYEYWTALTLGYLCRAPGARVSQRATLRVTAWGLACAWPAGLIGWGVWAWRFGALSTPLSAGALAAAGLLAHVIFCALAVGHLPRAAREQQRVLEHTYLPMLQAYEHQLSQLRAQKALLESETA